MATTPSSSRGPPVSGLGLKLTPSNSSYQRSAVSKVPIRSPKTEISLALRRIIGTTTSSPCAFDCLASSYTFVYTAGAAAVFVRLDADLNPSQRFFRAKPTALSSPFLFTSSAPVTPTGPAQESRNRTLSYLKDGGAGTPSIGSPAADWCDSPSQRTLLARERLKAATCVSLSRDGKYLAVGESGHAPRVLVFSTAFEAHPEIPLSIISEHTFGVRAVAFGPDSRYLATLGTMNDGFLYIWQINPKTGSAVVCSSNKCTSFIHGMAWVGDSLITVGTRHVKVWRVGEAQVLSPQKHRLMSEGTLPLNTAIPSPKPLVGRNCLLGPLVESTFTCVAGVTEDKAIVCTDKGDICLLNHSTGTQQLTVVAQAGFSISTIDIEPSRTFAWLGGKPGVLKSVRIDELLQGKFSSERRSPIEEERDVGGQPANILVVGCLKDHLVLVDSHHSIKVLSFVDMVSAVDSPLPMKLSLPAHQDTVMGVKILGSANKLGAQFYTWSSDGHIFFWSMEGYLKRTTAIELEQLNGTDDEYSNELKVVRASPEADFFVTGDKYGVLRIIDFVTSETKFMMKVHGGEIMDIAVAAGESRTLIASCSRDRTIQVFYRVDRSWELLQTLADHNGAVTGVSFLDKGGKLLSRSSDRTVIIRELAIKQAEEKKIMAYLPFRTLTFKTTPVSTAYGGENDDTLFVSTIDRQIHKVDVTSGHTLQTFRASDTDNNEGAVMDCLVLFKESLELPVQRMLGGVSTTDKSIRLYDHQTGMLLDKAWGHTEGITGVDLIEDDQAKRDGVSQRALVSTGIDGTIMIWDVILSGRDSQEVSVLKDQEQETPVKETTLTRPPLRKVLSRSELSEFQKSTTPAGSRSPPRTIRKKMSKPSLATAAKMGVSKSPPMPPNPDTSGRRGSVRSRSPSPSRAAQQASTRRPSLDARFRTKSSGNLSEFGSLVVSTEQLCRTLRAYRKKLVTSTDTLRQDTSQQLEKELRLTAKALSGRPSNVHEIDEALLLKVMDQYSDKFEEMIEEKIARRVDFMRERKVSGRHKEDELNAASIETATAVA